VEIKRGERDYFDGMRRRDTPVADEKGAAKEEEGGARGLTSA